MAEEMRIVLRNYGKISPLNIDDYIARGGYKNLDRVRDLNPSEIISEVKRARLRGRSGAGFSCGDKWHFVRSADSEPKYLICNADEGEPGSYKDRTIMENDPHLLIEGMAIGAYAIEATKAYIYLRGEYPFLVDVLNHAIKQAQDRGVLKGLDIEVRKGAGAYVCGEETAMIESIEGKRGEPRYKPPYPATVGLWNQPTVVNNVETLANIPAIIEKGAEWYASIGAELYPGTVILTLTGDVNNRTFFEVPTGTTIRQMIYEFGEGIPDNKNIKAVQIGGTSGAFIPLSLLDTSLDFDSMAAVGASLGSGAIFVLDESRDIVDVVTRIAGFFEHESCGKCTPCREGTARIVELLRKINSCSGCEKDSKLLERLGRVMSCTSLCGLGQTAPTAVLSTLKYFSSEYNAKYLLEG